MGFERFDIAISFAGPDREIARGLAYALRQVGYCVFFDEFYEASLWGEDLPVAFGRVYDGSARFCLILVSQAYVQRSWPNLERQHAIAHQIGRMAPYILPLQLDGTLLPGLPSTVGYQRFRSVPHAIELLGRRLGPPISPNSESDFEYAVPPPWQPATCRECGGRMIPTVDGNTICSSCGTVPGPGIHTAYCRRCGDTLIGDMTGANNPDYCGTCGYVED